ncbi:hypothetical protein [Novipirellula aureliae]|uniref:hypothetical protein n=1 Tax=Novipirellula aureliae TaxID=2527966 RepID=UPI0011B421FD|nr:hypothetical protein [Novipirellula aureliae]
MKRQPKSGIILLVVLSMLTFFSLLLAAYLVFSNQSRQSAFAMASRTTHAPQPNQLLDDALMTLIRGTGDVNDPFYGEDLLSDFYGRRDAHEGIVAGSTIALGPAYFNSGTVGGFIRFPIQQVGNTRIIDEPYDDVLTGRLITFEEGPLANRTYRILRSIYRTSSLNTDDVFIELDGDEGLELSPTPTQVRTLFYANPADETTAGYPLHLNGVPRNSKGVGFDGTAVTATAIAPQQDTVAGIPANIGFSDLPMALQPNHLRQTVNKSLTVGDFDEGYDAADFNNWFLSARDYQGNVIPSFHRPSVINYILNQANTNGSYDWVIADPISPDPTDPTVDDYRNLLMSLARGTFRPLPFGAYQFGSSSVAMAEDFNGGSSEFALRTPIRLIGAADTPFTSAHFRLDQLARSLVRGEWDVDNDGDGKNDSIWMNLNLPIILSPEGKLLRPMIAPMIEDLSGRLNVNAHGNTQIQFQTAAMRSDGAEWAGSRYPFNDTNNDATIFRGVGYGPAEITIPMTSNSGLIADTSIETGLAAIQTDRLVGDAGRATQLPGQFDADALDVLRTGPRPPAQLLGNGYGYSIDPFGRGGIGIGRGGNLVAAESGRIIAFDDPATTVIEPTINEAVNDPYEMDPTGRLSGDEMFTLDELEAILRSSEFDTDVLPQRLRNHVAQLIESHQEFSRALTTRSLSSDSLPTIDSTEESPLVALVKTMQLMGGSTLTNAQIAQLIAPEIRLGRKLDINRPLGNGIDDLGTPLVDDDGDGNVDEADERNGVIDEPFEAMSETEAFVVSPGSGQVVPTEFQSNPPTYTFGETTVQPGQLLARHLYTLMMALTNDGVAFPSVSGAPPASFDSALYKARRIAQWAVNVVDYRDPDSIMTRFPYDPNPFDATGWSPPTTSVVWGVEAPELVLTESMAFHDIRCRDTDRDTTGNDLGDTPADNDTDQIRIPEGSLFLELYCPRPATNVLTTTSTLGDETSKSGIPLELYELLPTGTGEHFLDLDRLAPPQTGGTVGAPVWRIAISEPHVAGSGKQNANPERLRANLPDSASFEPRDPDELDPTSTETLNYDRFIWFNNFGNAAVDPAASLTLIDEVIAENVITGMNANQVFFPPPSVAFNSNRTIEPGQYLCLAPRSTTVLGSKEFNVGAYPGVPSEQGFEATSGGLLQYRHDGGRLTPDMMAANSFVGLASSLVIGAPRPATLWGSADDVFADDVVGLNVSEPLPNGTNYYPEPMLTLNGTVDLDGAGGIDYALTDAYVDFSTSGNTALDEPLDIDIDRLPDDGKELELGTIEEYCSVFLQRLADPLQPYNAVTNPYRTVDWMNVDLTIFNGEDRDTDYSGPKTYARRSRQKNGFVKRVTGAPIQGNSLYSYETDFSGPQLPLDNAALDYFSFSTTPASAHIWSSFGFLNTDTLPWAATVTPTLAATMNPGFVGFATTIGSEGMTANNVIGQDRGLPIIPFAIHPWLNRPYATHLELMMVPACSQGRLFEEFSFDPGGANPAVYPTTGNGEDPAVFNATFRHLLNFFHDSEDSADSAHFARIFDFVHTLPRYRGEVEYLNRSRLEAHTDLAEMRSLLLPPFNLTFDNLREGTVNLNTLAEFPVWAGLMQGHLNPAEFSSLTGSGTATQLSFESFLNSRRGYAVPGGAMTQVTAASGPFNYMPDQLDHRFPTQFAGVFKNTLDAKDAPALRDATATDLLRRRGVNGTLMRGSGILESNDPNNGGVLTLPPMFVRDQGQLPTGSLHRDRARNPFMRYQTLMRMPNLVSDNSQIFLVRLTLGFFEVDKNDVNRLGAEYKESTGENERYQAMFIVDRSIPVGFKPGEDLNARDTVIFERFYQ